MSDARCEGFRELVSAFIDERLDGGEMLRLGEHFQTCAGCRAFEGELRRFRGLLQAAETFRPLHRPTPGFAAAVISRINRQTPAPALHFPAVHAAPRPSRLPWIGMVAAAATAALFLAWSWQRVLPVGSPEQEIVMPRVVPTVDVAAADGGSIDIWMREHAMLARGGTLLGSAEEIEFARIHAGAVPEH